MASFGINWNNTDERYSQLQNVREKLITEIVDGVFAGTGSNQEDLQSKYLAEYFLTLAFPGAGSYRAGAHALESCYVYETIYNPDVLNEQVKQGLLERDSVEYKAKYGSKFSK